MAAGSVGQQWQLEVTVSVGAGIVGSFVRLGGLLVGLTLGALGACRAARLFWSRSTLFRPRGSCVGLEGPHIVMRRALSGPQGPICNYKGPCRPCVDLAVIRWSGRTFFGLKGPSLGKRALFLPKRSMCWLGFFLCWYEECCPDRQSPLSGRLGPL